MPEPTILPLSYGPTALCLRLRDGTSTYRVSWPVLAREVSGRPDAEAVTLHHQADGTLSVSVDNDDLDIKNFSTVNKIAEFIKSKQGI